MHTVFDCPAEDDANQAGVRSFIITFGIYVILFFSVCF